MAEKCVSCEANKQGVTINKDTINGLMETIRNLYLCDDIPWVIGYSGGKDSTATLQLVWLALSELPRDQVKKQVHIINTDTMGTGDEKLGKQLLKGFIFALSKQDILPASIIFYNRGAFMTTEGSESIEDLKNLEAMGVEILTCGTCMDYYGIKDKLQVGTSTNMYVIVEKQVNANRIVRP